jgi:hypothetical protein
VRNVEHDALPPDHAVAKAVQGLKPGDMLVWPLDRTTAEITAAKHKYLDAFHAAMERYNERFPDATGLKRITFKPLPISTTRGCKALDWRRAPAHTSDRSARLSVSAVISTGCRPATISSTSAGGRNARSSSRPT